MSGTSGRHTPLPVAGYTDQPKDAIDLVNRNKEIEERLLRHVDMVLSHNTDPRWLHIARTHFEQGFMALNRSVFRPQRIKLDGDP